MKLIVSYKKGLKPIFFPYSQKVKKKCFFDNKYIWKNFRHFPKKSRAVIEVGAQRIGPQMSH